MPALPLRLMPVVPNQLLHTGKRTLGTVLTQLNEHLHKAREDRPEGEESQRWGHMHTGRSIGLTSGYEVSGFLQDQEGGARSAGHSWKDLSPQVPSKLSRVPGQAWGSGTGGQISLYARTGKCLNSEVCSQANPPSSKISDACTSQLHHHTPCHLCPVPKWVVCLSSWSEWSLHQYPKRDSYRPDCVKDPNSAAHASLIWVECGELWMGRLKSRKTF